MLCWILLTILSNYDNISDIWRFLLFFQIDSRSDLSSIDLASTDFRYVLSGIYLEIWGRSNLGCNTDNKWFVVFSFTKYTWARKALVSRALKNMKWTNICVTSPQNSISSIFNQLQCKFPNILLEASLPCVSHIKVLL